MPTAADRRANILLVIAGAALLIGILDLLDAITYYGTLGVTAIKIPGPFANGILGHILPIGTPVALIARRCVDCRKTT